MDSVALEVMVRISGKRKFIEPWMTQGIENSNNHCQKLYKKTLVNNCTDEVITAYKAYWNVLNRLKCKAKCDYYNNKSLEYRSNTRKLWQLINSRINKCKHQGSIIPFITVKGIKTYDPIGIANNFGQFYSEMRANLAATIKPGRTTAYDYIDKIPRIMNSAVLTPTNPREK